MRRRIKPIVLSLTAIFAVCGAIAGILVMTQILPDIEQYGSVSGKHMEPYSESWSIDFTKGSDLAIDSLAVDVDVRAHDGGKLEVAFQGRRSPAANGEMPYIDLSQSGAGVLIKERRIQDGVIFNFGIGASGHMQGTLTISVPRESLGEFSVNGFSGRIDAQGLQARRIDLDSSSGNIAAENLSCEGDFTATTFSGNHILTDIAADRLRIEASSGRIEATRLRGGDLKADSFSGKIAITDALIQGDSTLSTSSGDITLARFETDSLNTDQYSGRLELEEVRVKNAGQMSTSSGNIQGRGAQFAQMSFNTFSGSVDMRELSAETIDGETSSGKVSLALEGTPDATISTFSGKVDMGLPPDAGFAYQIDTFSGRINVGFGQQMSVEGRITKRSGIVGEGERRISVSTSSGDVAIDAL